MTARAEEGELTHSRFLYLQVSKTLSLRRVTDPAAAEALDAQVDKILKGLFFSKRRRDDDGTLQPRKRTAIDDESVSAAAVVPYQWRPGRQGGATSRLGIALLHQG